MTDVKPVTQRFFVYGETRRGGEAYEAVFEGKTIAESEATLEGHDLYCTVDFGFPFALEGEGVVTGDLFTIHPDHYEELSERLDLIESYFGEAAREEGINLHERREVTVNTPDGAFVAWVYVLEDEKADAVRESQPKTPHNDWIRHRKEVEKA